MSTGSAKLYREVYATPFGNGALLWDGDSLIAHELPRRGVVEGASVTGGTMAARLLERYFRGEEVEFSKVSSGVKQHSDFARALVRVMRGIEYGTTMSYSGLAAEAGFSGAQRAVGTWLARNPLPVIIPCHRIIRADGSIGRFSSGEAWKQKLLQLEGIYFAR